MMTCGLLQIKNEKNDDVVDLISFQGRKKEMCKLYHTRRDPPKLILTRYVITYNGNYNALPHSYRNF
jgi:hypothetical protein